MLRGSARWAAVKATACMSRWLPDVSYAHSGTRRSCVSIRRPSNDSESSSRFATARSISEPTESAPRAVPHQPLRDLHVLGEHGFARPARKGIHSSLSPLHFTIANANLVWLFDRIRSSHRSSTELKMAMHAVDFSAPMASLVWAASRVRTDCTPYLRRDA